MAHPWDRSVFTLVMPDAIATHRHTEVLRRIEGAGYRIAYFELLTVAPEQLDEVYAEQIKSVWDAYFYRLLDKLFLSGPVIGLVMEDVTGGEEDAHRRLKLLKGATDPNKAAPGTIRRDLGGINSMLAFMHAADQPEVSVREAGLLFTAPVSADAPPRGDAAAGTDETAAHAVCDLLASGPAETRGFPEVLAGHRSRVAGAAWHDLSERGRATAREATARGTLAEPGLGALIADGLRGGEAHPAHGLLHADWRPGLPTLPERRYLTALAGLGLPRDHWEELVLLTSAYFPPKAA
ncbi:nucleoside-diphosphate kinase [Sphaerisporangium aureirubrum]|uniref:nucleoside-diphosphate kinase n=1 Tax=Sphaerisporangium aureirubrum TaxID=1544736 RepID=A0ABW1NL89_9ACTN